MAEKDPPGITAWFDQNDSTRPRGRRAVTRVFKQSSEDIMARFADERERRNSALDASFGLALKNATHAGSNNMAEPAHLDLAFRAALEPNELEESLDHLLEEAMIEAEFSNRLDRRLGFHLRSLLLDIEELDSARQHPSERAFMHAWDKVLTMSEAA